MAVFAGLLGGVVSSWLFVGTPVFAQKTEVAGVIRAERFEVVDKNGKFRAVFYLWEGEPSLALFDKNGKNPALLALENGKPLLALADKNEKRRAGLFLSADGEPYLGLFDQNGKVIWSAP